MQLTVEPLTVDSVNSFIGTWCDGQVTRWRLAPCVSIEAGEWNLPYLPFRPVREQLWKLVYWMNQARKQRGLPGMLNAKRGVRRKIPAVSAFEVHEEPRYKAA